MDALALEAGDSVRPAPVLPPAVAATLWRASELGGSAVPTLSTGWTALDAELPGHGWPTQSLTEILQPQPTVAEWRLLGHVLGSIARAGREVVAVGPPKHPHLPGLAHLGIDDRRFIWIQASAPAERLWTVEQLIKANAAGAIVAWLPQARQEQIRRLQIAAQSHEGPVFLCRPESALHEPSAAPLRIALRSGLDWQLRLRVPKRRGAAFDGELLLPSVPGGLGTVLTSRVARPSALLPTTSSPASVLAAAAAAAATSPHALGRFAPRPPGRHERSPAH